ncbi:hypothetical protein GY45DRAFT_1315929 [Cubamyces sp. BRFM 1775]|nr:hypothetical protein GY45DRAFT_1315929 [Cubamyces sp. BRFM 1775]
MPLVIRGYGAYISCDGEELKTHQAKAEDKVASCYIVSDPGKEYRVHWVDSKPPTHLSVEVRVDGRRIGVVSHTKGSSKSSATGLCIALDAHDHSHAAPHDALPSVFNEEVGTVEVRLRRVRDFVAVPVPPKATSARRNAKGSTASVAPGKRPGAPQKPATVLRPILIDDKPYVIFRFMYRTQEYLEAHGLIGSGLQSSSTSTLPTSKDRRKKRASEASSTTLVDMPPSKRRRKSTNKQGLSSTSRERSPDDDMYLDVPEDCGEPAEIGSSAEAAPVDAFGDFGQPLESCSIARGAIQPSEHVNGSDDEDERMVEMHLSSCKVISQPEQDIHSTNVKTEVAEPALRVKREPDLDVMPPLSSMVSTEHDAEPPVDENGDTEEPVVEIHVNSRNRRALFGTPAPDRVVKKEEEVEQPLLPHNTGEYQVKTEEDESDIVEVHLSSANLQEAFRGMASSSVKQEHVKEEP